MGAVKNKEMFKQAILEGLEQRFEDKINASTESAESSDEHLKKMSLILGVDVTNGGAKPISKMSRFSRALTAACVALALLIPITVAGIVFREELTELFYGYKKEENAVLGYVPKGFELYSNVSMPNSITSMYSNSSGAVIEVVMAEAEAFGFKSSDFDISIDPATAITESNFYSAWNSLGPNLTSPIYKKKGDFYRKEIMDLTIDPMPLQFKELIFYAVSEDIYCYSWSDSFYGVTIFSNTVIDIDELIKIKKNVNSFK